MAVEAAKLLTIKKKKISRRKEQGGTQGGIPQLICKQDNAEPRNQQDTEYKGTLMNINCKHLGKNNR